jgi:hypothetical protein
MSLDMEERQLIVVARSIKGNRRAIGVRAGSRQAHSATALLAAPEDVIE